jgi:hypothetical protein
VKERQQTEPACKVAYHSYTTNANSELEVILANPVVFLPKAKTVGVDDQAQTATALQGCPRQATHIPTYDS